MEKWNVVDWIAMVLVIIGAINWGLVGLFSLNLVAAIFGGIPLLAAAVYVVIGIAGLWFIYMSVREGAAAS